MIIDNKAGRPQKYPDELLIKCIQEYRDANPLDSNITFAKLSKATGIPYYVFRDNKKINMLVKSLSSITTLSETTKVRESILPSANELAEANFGKSKKELAKSFQGLLDVIIKYQGNDDKVKNFYKIEADYKAQIKELKLEIERLKNENESLNREIDLQYLDSQSATKRKEKGLIKNLIFIDEYDKDGLDINEDELGNSLSLFDGLDD